MESAALFLLSSGLGVMFGWQPMPDGSARYEYVVQLEPELVATLEAGQSIPITSDVPEAISPIGRIRIVVGRGDLPRRELTTRRKPLPEETGKKSREGVIETQFTSPRTPSDGNGRYGTQPTTTAQILPPASDSATSNDPFARALQRGAQQARNNAAQGAQILPPQPSRPNSPPGNQGEQVDQYGRLLHEHSIVTTNDNHTAPGGGIAPAFDDRQGAGAILPPASTGRQPVASNPITPPAPRIDQPTSSVTRNDWQQGGRTSLGANSSPSADTAPNPTSPPGLFDAPWPPIVRHDNPAPPTRQNPLLASGDRYGTQQAPPPASDNWPDETARDLFDIAKRPTEGPSRVATIEPPRAAQNTDWPAEPPATPVIRRGMLDSPANAGVQASNGQPVAANSGPPLQQTASRPVSNPPVQAGSWPIDRQPTAPTTQSAGAATTSVFPLLLSWVLLSGSGAGNLYLFWSYLDVRNKYRGLAYNSRRDGSSRRSSYED